MSNSCFPFYNKVSKEELELKLSAGCNDTPVCGVGQSCVFI